MSILEVIFSPNKCLICRMGPHDDEEELGPFIYLREFSVHYMCVLTGANLPQKGRPNEGLLGFLFCDITAAFKLYCKRMCLGCMRTGASLKCAACARTYHLSCGLKNGVIVQMLGSFLSFCKECAPAEFVPTDMGPLGNCPICLAPASTGGRLFYAPCCKSREPMHISCLQHYALTAGYLTKCPLCANKRKFRSSIKKSGVYIPNRDAFWLSSGEESAPQIYRLNCCAEVCRANTDVILGVLVYCIICSDIMAHYECTFASIFVCQECTDQLWPENSVTYECTSLKENAESLLFIENDKEFNASFPWLIHLLNWMMENPDCIEIVVEVVTRVEMKLSTNETSYWHGVVDDDCEKFLKSKLRDFISKDENYIGSSLNIDKCFSFIKMLLLTEYQQILSNVKKEKFSLKIHPADADLAEIEHEIFKREAAQMSLLHTDCEQSIAAGSSGTMGPPPKRLRNDRDSSSDTE